MPQYLSESRIRGCETPLRLKAAITTRPEKGGLQIDGDEDTDHKRSILKSGRSDRNHGTQIMMISAHLCGPPGDHAKRHLYR
jgi:hypothetical protein